MRRTAVLAAAAAASVISVGLISPAAQAAAPAPRLVGTTSCAGGGTIRLATSIDADRTAKAVATVSGAKQNRFAGLVVAGIDETFDMSKADAAAATKAFRAVRGTFTTVATQPGASSANAFGYFVGSDLRTTCSAVVVQRGTQYGVMLNGVDGLIVAAGARSALDASIGAERNHRYRASFTVAGAGRTQHLALEKTAKRKGVLGIVERHVKRLARFSKVSLTVTDLTDRKTQPLTYSIGR
ncbi:MAG: hypothetical protein ACXVWW_09375 [Nocardioides sp.]